VTMVLAVEAGHNLRQKEAGFYMILTVIGGIAFLSCQAWEWLHLIDHHMTLSGNLFGPNHSAGPPLFGQLFFAITGFHGAHVTSGVIINIIVTANIFAGTYQKRKNYEIVEKIGLYWHFVDLVWVFVFTFFYLV
jgi:cytochrome c oxidase subunit III